jgi:hypothetical protein
MNSFNYHDVTHNDVCEDKQFRIEWMKERNRLIEKHKTVPKNNLLDLCKYVDISPNEFLKTTKGKKFSKIYDIERRAINRVVNEKSGNRRKSIKAVTAYVKKRKKEDPSYKLEINLRCRMKNVIRIAKKRKGSKKTFKINRTIDYLGITLNEFLEYIEKKFKDRMTWENYGLKGWHIDHIKPCAAFDLTKESERRKCFHYTNMQPLWATENIQKGAKYEQGKEINFGV